MKTLSLLLVVVGLLTTSVPSDVSADNRFGVFTYHDFDPTLIVNEDSFYVWLDDFGASDYYAIRMDSAAYYRSTASLGYDLYTTFGGPMSFDLAASQYEFDYFFRVSASLLAEMDGLNDVVSRGYRRNTSLSEYCGREVSDPHTVPPFRSVLASISGTDTAGMLHTIFDRGCFHWHPMHFPMNTEARYEVKLRCDDLDTSGIGNAVVARLIVSEFGRWEKPGRRAASACPVDSLNPYTATRLIQGADTLLRVGSDSGWITLPVAPVAPNAIWISTNPDICDQDSVVMETFRGNASGPTADVCYVNGDDTVCVRPFRYELDIHVLDFDSDTSYQSFTMPFIGGDWCTYAYEVEWTGVKSIYMDSFYVYDWRGDQFKIYTDLDTAGVKTQWDAWKTAHPGVAEQITAASVIDEPRGPELQVLRRMKNLHAILPDLNDRMFTTLYPVNAPTDDTLRSQYFDTYINYTTENYFMYDDYKHPCYMTSSSDVFDSTGLQYWVELRWNGLGGYITGFQTAQRRVEDMNLSGGWWVVLPTFDGLPQNPDSNGRYCNVRRSLTVDETRMLAHLALAYGAKGVGYYTYATSYWATTRDSLSVETARDRTAYHDLITGEYVSDFTDINSQLATLDACTCYTSESLPEYRTRGIMKLDESGNAVKTEMWYGLQSLNSYLDSMAYFFNNAEWRSATRWTTDTLRTMAGSFLDSVKSLTHPDTLYDSAFVQVAFFTLDSLDYCYIVNRRVMNDTVNHVVDSQTVRLYFKDPPGCYEIVDIYQDAVIDTVFDSAGTVIADIFFGPGEARLIRRNKIHDKEWIGNISANWTWPPGATIDVVGDITVDSGFTLKIQTDSVFVRNASDSAHGGVDTLLVEIVVEGDLRIEGTANNRIRLGWNCSENGWYGIRSTNAGTPGHVFIDNALIRNAYFGAKITTNQTDTIQNSRFEKIGTHGIYTMNDNLLVKCDTFYCHPSWNCDDNTGVYLLGSNATIEDCYFVNVDKPLYAYSSSPTIRGTDFVKECGVTLDTVQFNPAIEIDSGSNPTLFDCKVWSYDVGMSVGGNCDPELSGCAFTSDTGWIPCHMKTGIVVNASGSLVKVRDCCFGRIYNKAVHNAWLSSAGFDLGKSSDTADNRFIYEYIYSLHHDAPRYGPAYAIYNMSFHTMSAQANRFDTGDTLLPSPWIYGQIDTSRSSYASGQSCHFDSLTLDTIVYEGPKVALPEQPWLSENYPNPFNSATQLLLSLPNPVHVKLEILNVLGQRVTTVVDAPLASGEHVLSWDGTNESGETVASGVYLFRTTIGEAVHVRKAMLLK